MRTYEGARPSTRAKDLVDLALIADLSPLKATLLRHAIDRASACDGWPASASGGEHFAHQPLSSRALSGPTSPTRLQDLHTAIRQPAKNCRAGARTRRDACTYQGGREMSEGLYAIDRAIEQDKRHLPERTRRQFVGAAAATLGGMGLAGVLPSSALAGSPHNDTQTILNVAATAEVLATIVNTVGFRRGIVDDDVTQRNIRAAAQEELRHYDVLVSLGATPSTKRIWVPDAVFESGDNLLETLVVGDQIFVNAYLIGVAAFAKADPKLAAVPAEFMGAEAVHRALALQSLGRLGNDRIFMAVEFFDILEAVTRLKKAGFGFGEKGARPGRFFNFDNVRRRTPTDPDVNTPDPTPINP